jgi:hypothetical protein
MYMEKGGLHVYSLNIIKYEIHCQHNGMHVDPHSSLPKIHNEISYAIYTNLSNDFLQLLSQPVSTSFSSLKPLRKMANTYFTIISLLLLLVAFSYTQTSEATPYTTEKKIDVVVETTVYCQSCEHSGTWSLIGAKPIPSAKVSITCKTHRGHVSYYKVFETDKNGYLYAQLEGFKMQNYILDHPLHSCFVKPVWSPLEGCSLLANVNYGLNGSPLRYENKRLHGSKYQAVIYAAGPLAFHPPDCSKTHY